MPEKNNYIEVKVHAKGIYSKMADKIIDQGVIGIISGGKIADKAKKKLDDAQIWYRDNVEPEDLKPEKPEGRT